MGKPEGRWLKYLKEELKYELQGLEVFTGQGPNNEILPIPNCEEKVQFGDFRIETPNTTVVIELESGGGIDNFLKYWPYLSGQTKNRPNKKFVLIHIYGRSYPSAKALWWFFRSRLPSLIVDAEFILFENDEKQKEKIVEAIRGFLTN